MKRTEPSPAARDRSRRPGARLRGARLSGGWLLGVAIAMVAANLRPALASVGPVLSDVRADLGLSGAEAALLTALPVLFLGLLAATAPSLGRRWGLEPVLAAVLGVIVAGLLVRVAWGVSALFAGTVLAAGAIAVANVLLPALIKRDFPTAGGTMMGVYTMALTGFAALAAGVTVPLQAAMGGSWRGALGFWALPAALALLAWLPFARAGSRGHDRSVPLVGGAGGSLLRDPLAWQVTVYFGLQSLSFYAVLSWLPSVYREHGYGPAAAGLVLSVSALVQIPVSLLLPRLLTRAADQRAQVAACALLTAAGLAGVLFAPTAAPFVWAAILGLGQGGNFAVALTLLVLRTRVSTETARLSAMAQTAGYVIAAGGPLLLGAVRDASGSWTLPLALLLLLLLPQLAAGLLSGRPLHVGERAR